MIDESEERQSEPNRLIDLHLKALAQADLLDFYPALLLLGDEHVSKLLLLLDCVEVIDDDTDEEIDNELATHYHECYKKCYDVDVGVLLRL